MTSQRQSTLKPLYYLSPKQSSRVYGPIDDFVFSSDIIDWQQSKSLKSKNNYEKRKKAKQGIV
jgi:hypothetical protein